MTPAPVPDYSPDPTLTPLQHRIITLLASGNTITEAAAAESIHRNTIGYWRRTIPAFARELEFAQREQRLFRHEVVTRLMPQAIQVIEGILNDPSSSPSLRFRAATLILKMATDPLQKAQPGFPALPPEVEAISGQMLALQKVGVVQPSQTAPAAQQCTKNIALPAQECTKPIRLAPQPGRNSLCPCGSGIKFKRCCANKPAVAA